MRKEIKNSKNSSINIEREVAPLQILKKIFATLKNLNFHSAKAFNKTGKDSFIIRAFLFAIILNILMLTIAFIFTTFTVEQHEAFFLDVVDYIGLWVRNNLVESTQPFQKAATEFMQKALSAYPFAKGWSIFIAFIVAVVLFILRVLFLHLAIMPQKPKGSLKSTFKIAAYAEAPKIYFIFFFIYLMILKIPDINPEAFIGIFYKILILLSLIYIVTKFLIIKNGCMKLHKLEENEALFVAFWPLIGWLMLIFASYFIFNVFAPVA